MEWTGEFKLAVPLAVAQGAGHDTEPWRVETGCDPKGLHRRGAVRPRQRRHARAPDDLGRPRRRALHMATLVASRHNPVIRCFYQRLLASGKAKKLALTAAMRKLLVILNAMLRDGTPWQPAHSA